MKKRVIILLLDSFGLGSAADACDEDKGANTFVHIAEVCAKNLADIPNRRQGALKLPNLSSLGLIHSAVASNKDPMLAVDNILSCPDKVISAYGYAKEISFGKDTPSGHWEIAGVPALFDWGYFSHETPTFPEQLVENFIKEAQLPGILGKKHASGTVIIDELGEEHIKTGMPIVYTSGDSVFQIAAHEHYFGLDRLYKICEIARKLVDEYNIGRVIARPFLGEVGHFYRTGNRRDLAIPPPEPTLLDYSYQKGNEIVAIGKIADIYAHSGISHTIKADGNNALFQATLDAMALHQKANTIIFTNFVDFDMNYGHRRDVPGYALALEQLDQQLPELMNQMTEDDLLVITADHGCDPTWPGSDHTREHIPVLMYGKNIPSGFLGERQTFADIGQTIATYLDLNPLRVGTACLQFSDDVWSLKK